jgi:hypothetical protein
MILSNSSVDIPEINPPRGYIRATVKYGGFVISPISPGRSQCKFIQSRHLGGTLFTLAAKGYMENQPLMIDGIAKNIKNTTINCDRIDRDWKAFMDRHFPDRLKSLPSRSVIDVKSETARDAKSPADSKEDASKDDVLTKEISFHCAAGQAMALLMQKMDVNISTWSKLNDRMGVQVFVDSSSSIPCYKAETVLPAPAIDLFEILRLGNKRQWIDSSFESYELLSRINKDLRVCHYFFETAHCSRPQDFVVVEKSCELPDGKFAIGYKSVTHQSKPPARAVNRGEVLVAGWMLEPVNDDADGDNQGRRPAGIELTKVSYIYQVDLKLGGEEKPLSQAKKQALYTEVFEKQQPSILSELGLMLSKR